jgi:hypothetical protein
MERNGTALTFTFFYLQMEKHVIRQKAQLLGPLDALASDLDQFRQLKQSPSIDFNHESETRASDLTQV